MQVQTKEGLLSAETLGSTTARTESQRQQFNTDFVVFSFCILKATTYQIFASFRKGETKAEAANIVHQAQSEFLTHATVTGAIALKQRSALFEAIQCKSGPPSEFYKARSRQPPSACAIPRRPETIKGPSHLPPRYFDENLTNFMLLCKLFNIIELFVNIFNRIQLLGDWQIPCIFSETTTQNVSTLQHDFHRN